MALVLQDIINLIPDSFIGAKDSSASIYKILQVFVEEFNKDFTIIDEIFDLTDIANLNGTNLERRAADFGITRDGRTDEELRVFVTARLFNFITGNDANSIIRFLNFFVDENDVQYNPLYLTSLVNFRPLAFDMEIGPTVTESLRQNLLNALIEIKQGGVAVTVNDLEEFLLLLQNGVDAYLTQDGDQIIL